MKNKSKNKPLPELKSDKEAEDFVANANLTDYDLRELKPMKFEFASKSARINMRLPESLLLRIKKLAGEKDIPYTRFIRQILEKAVTEPGR